MLFLYFQMFIQLQSQHLTIFKLKLEFLPVKPRIVPVDYPMVVWADDNDVGRVVVLRTGEVVNVVGVGHQYGLVPHIQHRTCRHWNGHPVVLASLW